MTGKLSVFFTRLSQAMAWLAGASLVGMVGIVVVDVTGRWLFPGFILNGTIELAVVCVVLLAYFGLPWAFVSNAHITVDVATAVAPEPVRRWLDVLWLAASSILAAVFSWLVLTTGIDLAGYGQVSEILGLSPLVTYGAAAFGLLITAIVTAYSAVVRARTRDDEPRPGLAPDDEIL